MFTISAMLVKSLLGLTSLLLCAGIVDAQDYDNDGPCKVSTSRTKLDLQQWRSAAGSILVTTTSPDANCSRHAQQKGLRKQPVVIFISGFKMRSEYYTIYAQRLASWGYFVLQYDTLPWRRMVADKDELQVLPCLMEWVASQGGAADVSRVVVAGHSRGGKLAALHLAGASGTPVLAAYLLDPVDCNGFAPGTPDRPCAVEWLAGKNKTLAMTGTSIRGQCNPLGYGFHSFFNVSGPGSWAFELNDCGHMQFIHASSLVEEGLDLLCGAGKPTHQEVQRLTLPAMVAWLELTVHGKQVPDFYRWAQDRVEDGSLTFQARPAEPGTPQRGRARRQDIVLL